MAELRSEDPDVPALAGPDAAAFVKAAGLGDLAALFAEEEMSEWCPSCGREHQKRDRPIECREDGCRTLTDGYHGLCPRHRPEATP